MLVLGPKKQVPLTLQVTQSGAFLDTGLTTSGLSLTLGQGQNQQSGTFQVYSLTQAIYPPPGWPNPGPGPGGSYPLFFDEVQFGPFDPVSPASKVLWYTIS
jgi:hypothetical protein